jgi:hypothetical protein
MPYIVSFSLEKCKDCKELFAINDNEREFYANKGWCLPVRCKSCRDKRKKNPDIIKYGNINELMNNNYSTRKSSRPKRVQYYPYVVGGFR